MHLAKSEICSQTQSRTHTHDASLPPTTSTPTPCTGGFSLTPVCDDKFVKRKLVLVTLGTLLDNSADIM